MAVSDGRVSLLLTALVAYQRILTDMTAFEQFVGLFKFVGVSMFPT